MFVLVIVELRKETGWTCVKESTQQKSRQLNIYMFILDQMTCNFLFPDDYKVCHDHMLICKQMTQYVIS